MDQQVTALLELSADPTIAVKEKIIVYINAAAQSAFPQLMTGISAGAILSDGMICTEADVLSGSVSIGRAIYRVRGIRAGEFIFYSLSSDTVPARGLFSDGLVAKLLSEMNIERLCMERISSALAGNPELEECMNRMWGSSYRLLRQASNLNMAVQLQERSAVVSMKRVELVSFCWELVNSVSQMRDKGRAALYFSTELPELHCEVDEVLLTKMLLNVLSNALERCDGDREIRVQLNQSGSSAVILVEDNGPGIAPEILRNVFSVYQLTADPQHLDRAVSAGLGLSVSEGIARLHGGVLMLESREGHGTLVSVQLPLEHSGMLLSAPRAAIARNLQDLYLTELSEVIDPQYLIARGLN